MILEQETLPGIKRSVGRPKTRHESLEEQLRLNNIKSRKKRASEGYRDITVPMHYEIIAKIDNLKGELSRYQFIENLISET